MAEPGTGTDPLRDRIIGAALALAEEDAGGGWYDLRLHLVAQRLGVPLGAVLERFRDADAIADAWFVRALRVWLNDTSPGQQCTRAFLRRNLGWLDRLPRRPAPDQRRRSG